MPTPRQISQRRYNASPKGQERAKRFHASPKYRALRRRYKQSAKGKAKQRLYSKRKCASGRNAETCKRYRDGTGKITTYLYKRTPTRRLAERLRKQGERWKVTA